MSLRPPPQGVLGLRTVTAAAAARQLRAVSAGRAPVSVTPRLPPLLPGQCSPGVLALRASLAFAALAAAAAVLTSMIVARVRRMDRPRATRRARPVLSGYKVDRAMRLSYETYLASGL
jgi:hypothetical protein